MEYAKFMNVTTVSKAIAALEYFDALSNDFYAMLFSDCIPDNQAFRSECIQRELNRVLTKSPSFRVYDDRGKGEHTSHGVTISYRLNTSGDGVESIIIKIDDIEYHRHT